MIKVENLHKSFNRNNEVLNVLNGIDVEFKKGEKTAIIGPSGSGKSTFLRCLNLLERPTHGSIKFEGEVITSPKCNINKVRRNIGMVFQHFNLFPHLTVIENMILAPLCLKIFSKEEAVLRAHELLKKVGLLSRVDSYPSELSGGQKQRVAIVRALIMDPKVMLFDEPTSALDPEMAKDVISIMTDIAKRGMTMIAVTHEIGFVKNAASRVLFMEEGRIIEDESPEKLIASSQSPRIKKFLERIL